MIRAIPLGIAIVAMVGARPAQAQAPVLEQSGDWMLVCDNRASCAIFGVVPPDEPRGRRSRVIFSFTRENEGGAPLLLQTRIVDEHGAPDTRLRMIDGLSLTDEPMGIPMLALRADETLSSRDGVEGFSAQESANIASVIAAESPTWIRHGFGGMATMPVGNFARLMRRMDEAQPAVPTPRVEAPRVRQERFLYELFPREEASRPIDHPVFTRACRGGTRRSANAYKLDHVAVEGTLLVVLHCSRGDHLFTWYPEGGGAPRRLELRRRVRPIDSVMTARFNPDQGILTITDHPPGRTDCGRRHEYGWVDGEGMVLLISRIMPLCRGIVPDQWPVQFMQSDWVIR